MFQIAYSVICIITVKSSVNGTVVGRSNEDQSSQWLHQLEVTGSPLTEEQSDNFPKDARPPMEIDEVLFALQKEIDKADDTGKKYYEKLLLDLKHTLSTQPLRYARIFFSDMWHVVDIGLLGSRRRTRGESVIDSILASLGDLFRWLAEKLYELWPLSSSTTTKEPPHHNHSDSPIEEFKEKVPGHSDHASKLETSKNSDQGHNSKTPPSDNPIHHHSSTGAPSIPSNHPNPNHPPTPPPVTTIHQIIHKFEIQPIEINFDINMTSRIINESAHSDERSSHHHQNNSHSQIKSEGNVVSSHPHNNPPATKTAEQLEDEKQAERLAKITKAYDEKYLIRDKPESNKQPAVKVESNPKPAEKTVPSASNISTNSKPSTPDKPENASQPVPATVHPKER